MNWKEEFERLKPQIEAALSYNAGTQTLQQVYDAIENGNMQLWPLQNSVLVTEVVKMPNNTLINIVLGGGDLDEIKIGVAFVEQMAKDIGAGGITIIGRKGWKKIFPEYREQFTVLLKEI